MLASGLAGIPVWTTTALLYERSAVEALAARREIDLVDAEEWAPHGLVVGRLDPRHGVAAGPWQASVVTEAMVAILTREHGPLPMVTSVGGFVVEGCDVVAIRGTTLRRVLFTLTPPGPWWDAVRDRRLATPPGNHLLFAGSPALSQWQVRPAGRPAAAG